MKAQIIQKFGAPSIFETAMMAKPKIVPNHVLIRVYATSVNPIDCKLRQGLVNLAPKLPAILHGDFSGIIEEVADDVQAFKVGDEVYGCAGGFRGLMGGALAEYIVADEKLLAKKPKSLNMREAAALPLVSITAWLALFEKVNLSKTSNILIHGGVGGVGHIATQLAKWVGAEIYATIRKQEDKKLLKSYGVGNAIVSTETVESYKNRLTQERGFQIIFDTVGGSNLDNSFEAASLNGKIVTVAARSTHDLTLLHNKGLSLHCIAMFIPFLTGQNRARYGDILKKIAAIVDEGALKPRIDPNIFTLEETCKAHTLLESGHACGKIVIDVP